MYEEILVTTDESDVAELPVRHRSPWRTRFIARLRSITHELLVPTGHTGQQVPDLLHEIQVPTDNASNRAIALASKVDARLHFLYVIDTRKYDTSIQSAVEPLEVEGERIVRHLVDAGERAGLDVTSTIETGRPVRTICAYADENDVDLIVMNTRDRVGLYSLLFGSLSERVSEHTDVDVWTVPSDEDQR